MIMYRNHAVATVQQSLPYTLHVWAVYGFNKELGTLLVAIRKILGVFTMLFDNHSMTNSKLSLAINIAVF